MNSEGTTVASCLCHSYSKKFSSFTNVKVEGITLEEFMGIQRHVFVNNTLGFLWLWFPGKMEVHVYEDIASSKAPAL